KEVSQNTEEWQVQTIVDSLTGSAESINEIFQKINAQTKKNAWDVTIGITDLPIFHEGKVVNADINEKNDVILISLPSLGWKIKKNVIKQLIIKIALTRRQSNDNINNKRRQSY